MRLITWNVNGLVPLIAETTHRFGSFSRFLSEVLCVDILCVQEAKVNKERLTAREAIIPGYDSFFAFSTAKRGHSGVVTYDLDTEGRAVLTDHGEFVIINVYVPNAGERVGGRPRLDYKLRFLRALTNKMHELRAAGKHVILAGDVNIAHTVADVHPGMRALPAHGYSEDEIAVLDAWLQPVAAAARQADARPQEAHTSRTDAGDVTDGNESGLARNAAAAPGRECHAAASVRVGKYVDVWRAAHPDAEGVCTVWDQKTEARVRNEGVRIDYILVDQEFYQQYCLPTSQGSAVVELDSLASACTPGTAAVIRTPAKWSDHVPVMLSFEDPPAPPPHPPAPLSSKCMKQFKRPGENIATMFLRAKTTPGAARLEGEGSITPSSAPVPAEGYGAAEAGSSGATPVVATVTAANTNWVILPPSNGGGNPKREVYAELASSSARAPASSLASALADQAATRKKARSSGSGHHEGPLMRMWKQSAAQPPLTVGEQSDAIDVTGDETLPGDAESLSHEPAAPPRNASGPIKPAGGQTGAPVAAWPTPTQPATSTPAAGGKRRRSVVFG